MQFSRMQNKIGYDTVPHQMYQPFFTQSSQAKILAFIVFAASFTWLLLMF